MVWVQLKAPFVEEGHSKVIARLARILMVVIRAHPELNLVPADQKLFRILEVDVLEGARWVAFVTCAGIDCSFFVLSGLHVVVTFHVAGVAATTAA